METSSISSNFTGREVDQQFDAKICDVVTLSHGSYALAGLPGQHGRYREYEIFKGSDRRVSLLRQGIRARPNTCNISLAPYYWYYRAASPRAHFLFSSTQFRQIAHPS